MFPKTSTLCLTVIDKIWCITSHDISESGISTLKWSIAPNGCFIVYVFFNFLLYFPVQHLWCWKCSIKLSWVKSSAHLWHLILLVRSNVIITSTHSRMVCDTDTLIWATNLISLEVFCICTFSTLCAFIRTTD